MTDLTAQDHEDADCMNESIPVATIKKNKKQEIRVSLNLLKGRRLFSAREFFKAEDGSMRPARSGIAFKVESLEEFAVAVASALVMAEKKGFVK